MASFSHLQLSAGIALLGCLEKPFGCLGAVLLYSLSQFVDHRQIELGKGISPVSRQAIKFDRPAGVLAEAVIQALQELNVDLVRGRINLHSGYFREPIRAKYS